MTDDDAFRGKPRWLVAEELIRGRELTDDEMTAALLTRLALPDGTGAKKRKRAMRKAVRECAEAAEQEPSRDGEGNDPHSKG
jgi:hypothetical protein